MWFIVYVIDLASINNSRFQQEVIELLSSFRDIMRRNFEIMDVDKIQERWWVFIEKNWCKLH